MNVKAIEERYNIKVKPCNVLIRRLKNQVVRFEKRYEIPTSEMLQEVHSGKMRETKEIDHWMQCHLVLGRLTNAQTVNAKRSARLEHTRKLPTHLQSVRSKPSVCRFNKASA